MVAFAKEHKPDLVMVAPDDPLALGMVDALEAVGIRAFGPRQERCHIEGRQVLCEGFNAEIQHPDRGLRCF